MLVVHKAWVASFARIDPNKKAIAERGWGLLNYAFLDNPELKKNANKQRIVQAYEQLSLTGDVPADINSLNTEDGISHMLLDKLIDNRSQQLGHEQLDQNACVTTARDKYDNATWVATGTLFAAQHSELGISVRDKEKDANQRKEQVWLEALHKKMDNEAVLMRKIQEVHAKGDGSASWNVKDVQVMASWLNVLVIASFQPQDHLSWLIMNSPEIVLRLTTLL